MKTVIAIKDSYQNNSFRVTYFEENAKQIIKTLTVNEDTGIVEEIDREEIYNKHLFCQRLEWVNEENELDSYIEEVRQYWENRINT